MTDLAQDPAPQAADPAIATGTGTGTAPDRPRRRTALRPVAAVLAAVVAGVGIGEVILHTRYQDDTDTAARPAATAPAFTLPSPSASPPYGARSNGNHFGSLRDLLLPVSADYEAGPDSGELGNDSEIKGEALKARQDQVLKDVPKKDRQEVESTWKSLHLLATGVRTYAALDHTFMVEMDLDQFNQHAVKAMTVLSGAVIDYSGAFRQGPAIAGHKEARCVLPPLEPSAQIDYMTCFAAEGDLLVSMDVTGVAPLNKNKAAQLLEAQLDRLVSPGAVV